jgi:hypothetical protein
MKIEGNNILDKSQLGAAKNTIRLGALRWILLLGAIFVIWFGWNSFEQSRTLWIETKVKNALNQSMESLSVNLPRIQVTDNNTGEVYYAPDINAQLHTFDLYGQTLIILNQDSGVPMLKLTDVSIAEQYNTSDTTLEGQATVVFPLIAGLDKEMIVRTSIQVPHYKNSN